MATDSTYRVKVTRSRRTGTTTNGNPKYVLDTDRGPINLREDTAMAYAVENDFPTGDPLNLAVDLVMDPAGQFYDWQVAR